MKNNKTKRLELFFFYFRMARGNLFSFSIQKTFLQNELFLKQNKNCFFSKKQNKPFSTNGSKLCVASCCSIKKCKLIENWFSKKLIEIKINRNPLNWSSALSLMWNRKKPYFFNCLFQLSKMSIFDAYEICVKFLCVKYFPNQDLYLTRDML
jgi:hypothetical protein